MTSLGLSLLGLDTSFQYLVPGSFSLYLFSPDTLQPASYSRRPCLGEGPSGQRSTESVLRGAWGMFSGRVARRPFCPLERACLLTSGGLSKPSLHSMPHFPYLLN